MLRFSYEDFVFSQGKKKGIFLLRQRKMMYFIRRETFRGKIVQSEIKCRQTGTHASVQTVCNEEERIAVGLQAVSLDVL